MPLKRSDGLLGLCPALLPGILKHHTRQLHQVVGRLQRTHDILEGPFDICSADRFTVAGAPVLRAQIVGVLYARTALRPARGHGLAAVIAKDETAQGEIEVDVLAGRGFCPFMQPFLNALERGDADQALVLAGAAANVPLRSLHEPSIDWPCQKVVDPLIPDLTIREAFRPFGHAFEKPLHFDLGFEAARGEALQGLLQDACEGFFAHEHVALTGDALVAISNRCREHGISVHQPCAHTVHGLVSVLLALMLRDACEQVLNKDGVRVLAELDRRAFQLSTCGHKIASQLQVCIETTRQARDIIDDDNAAMRLALLEEGKHFPHARTRCDRTGHVIGEDFQNFQTFETGVLPATGLLRAEAIASAHLLCARHTAVDHGLLRIKVGRFLHDGILSSPVLRERGTPKLVVSGTDFEDITSG